MAITLKKLVVFINGGGEFLFKGCSYNNALVAFFVRGPL